VKALVKKLVRLTGYEIRPFSSGYLPAQETARSARRAGLSVPDYVEELWREPGRSAAIVRHMAEQGVFARPALRVLEIGAGTGCFVDRVLAASGDRVASYESYEIAEDWAAHLRQRYPVVSHPADGQSLAHTATATVDVVHAHGVFVYTSFLTTYRYFREAWRVARPGAHIVFDAFTEDCFTEEHLARWLDSGDRYPNILPERFVVELFAAQGWERIASFQMKLGPAVSRYFIFRSRAPAGLTAPGNALSARTDAGSP
jgi:SAM-dependent methyltransferase